METISQTVIRHLADSQHITYKSLESLGYDENDLAIPVKDALKMVELIENEQIPILGGEIIEFNQGEFELIYWEWSCEPEIPFSNFVRNSCNEAIQNIYNCFDKYHDTIEKYYVNFTLYDIKEQESYGLQIYPIVQVD